LTRLDETKANIWRYEKQGKMPRFQAVGGVACGFTGQRIASPQGMFFRGQDSALASVHKCLQLCYLCKELEIDPRDTQPTVTADPELLADKGHFRRCSLLMGGTASVPSD
jgi:hypothetical protein